MFGCVVPTKNWAISLVARRDSCIARKRYSDEDALKLLREIELKLTAGKDVASASRSVRIRYATYYNLRKRFGGMGRARFSEFKSLEKENARLKKAVSELELNKLILKESPIRRRPGPNHSGGP